MKQVERKTYIKLKSYNMKKFLFIIMVFLLFLLVGCTKETKVPVENEAGENIINQENDPAGSGQNDQNQENDPTDNGQNNQDGAPNNNNQIENQEFEFKEDDFKCEIVITRLEDDYKKTFDEENYLDFFDVIKDYKYQKCEHCIEDSEPLYEISYNDNTILVYEYDYFKLDEVMYELTGGSFDFLKEYDYKISESSGWLPWI